MSGSFKSNSSLPLDNDIVKQGYLYIKRPPKNGFLRLKSWHKRYFVLRDETLDHPSRLEMYQKETDFCKNSSRRFCLNLDKVVHVGRTEDSKRFRQAFVIVCSGRTPLMLAEDDHLYTNSWLLAVTLIAEKRQYNNDGIESCIAHYNGPPFNHEFGRTPSGEFHDCLDDAAFNVCYSDSLLDEMPSKRYSVTVEPTKPSYRNGIDGDYDLVVHSWRLLLFRPSKDDVVVQWPICFIRKFKSEYLPHYNRKKCTLVTLELGRRCSTGEGIFQFRTQFGKEIIADINQAIFHSMSHRSINRSRSSFQGNCTVTSGFWKPLSRDNSSSRSVSLSRQSSGGACRTSRFMMDGSLQVVDLAGVLQNHNNISCSGQRRSPLRSDSSGDSKTLSDNIPQSRASVLSLLSSSSSSHSCHSVSSNESAEYIQAGFSSPVPPHSDRKDPWKFCQSTTPAFERMSNNTPLHDNVADILNGENIINTDDRATKAAAEGYLEVLPDFSSHTITDCNDFASIYHSMDFSKRTSSSPNHSRACSSAGSSSNRSENDKSASQLAVPSTQESNCDDPNDTASSVRKTKCGSLRNKPPAPLPRPVHTMS